MSGIRNNRVWDVFTKELYGKVAADRGYIKTGTLRTSSQPRDLSRA